jgi:hypothetical protein
MDINNNNNNTNTKLLLPEITVVVNCSMASTLTGEKKEKVDATTKDLITALFTLNFGFHDCVVDSIINSNKKKLLNFFVIFNYCYYSNYYYYYY